LEEESNKKDLTSPSRRLCRTGVVWLSALCLLSAFKGVLGLTSISSVVGMFFLLPAAAGGMAWQLAHRD